MKRVLLLLCFYGLIGNFIISCGADDDKDMDNQEIEETIIEEESEEPEPIVYPIEGDTGQILEHNKDLSLEGYILVIDLRPDRIYLMDKNSGVIKHEWNLNFGLGNDAELLPNGKLLVSLATESSFFNFGGFGGLIQIINPDSSIDWEFEYVSEKYLAHHDVEMLPNGNILVLTWDSRTLEEAREMGYSGEEEFIYTESIIEISQDTKEIVWRWDSWEHLVQDFDNSKVNFGPIRERPERININYVDDQDTDKAKDGNIMHANGLDYDVENDIIYLSVNFFSEIWVIDHSTTISEASNSIGGDYGKGGDLIYRFGNPFAYDNEIGERLFFNNHFPNLLENQEPGAGNILVFVNGNGGLMRSTVYELDIPDAFELKANFNNELSEVWSFTDEDLFSPRVSGAIRLSNGNTLITSGTYGYWEVTVEGVIVWRFKGEGFYWRGYHYSLDDEAIMNLGLIE